MKLIVEVDEKLYEQAIKDAKMGYGGSAVWIAVGHGTPYIEPDNNMELIDREALKNAFEHATFGNTDVLIFDNRLMGYVNQVIDSMHPIKTFTLEDVYKQYLAGLEKGAEE